MRCYALPILALLLGAASLTVLNQTVPEPSYEGRPLSAWMDGGSEPAALALHALGSRAIPFLLKKIRWEHPRWGYRQRYAAVGQRVPVWLRQFLPRSKAAAFDEERACSAFLEIGPPAIPALLKAMHDPNPGVRSAAAFTLGVFRQNGYSPPHFPRAGSRIAARE